MLARCYQSLIAIMTEELVICESKERRRKLLGRKKINILNTQSGVDQFNGAYNLS